jgi:inorganic pyrophosphatase
MVIAAGITGKPSARSAFTAHPWHGVDPHAKHGAFWVYIEIVPTDTVKYELHKPSGLLHVDRPQRFSSMCPTPYGFIPQTHCMTRVAKLCEERGHGAGLVGDGDPLDACILTEKTLNAGNILLRARPIGGLRMIDKNEVDDKIVMVLEDDLAFGHLREIADCPVAFIDRLRHYFLSYKRTPDSVENPVRIAQVYGAAEAGRVIACSMEDYQASFPE